MSEANNNLSAENTISSASPAQNIVPESQSILTNQEKEIDWHKLAHKLREHNRKLLKKVFQLEQEILESNQALEEQKKVSQSHDLYAAKQAEKINQYQEEIAELLQTITTSQQNNHNQQSTVENLEQELEISQQKVTKLEKSYSYLEAENQAKNQQLLAQEQQIQELSTRLHRQQQYFLEYKTSNYEKIGSQPIKAWSVQSAETTPFETTVFSLESNTIKAPDWPAPAIAKKHNQIKSLAAVKLPKFPPKAEGE